MEVIFPRLTKCNFFNYGPSGTIQYTDAMCILAQNALNDKIYLFLWTWFFILAVFSVLALVFRTILVMQISMNKTLLFNVFNFANNKKIMSTLVKKCHVRKGCFTFFNSILAKLNK